MIFKLTDIYFPIFCFVLLQLATNLTHLIERNRNFQLVSKYVQIYLSIYNN